MLHAEEHFKLVPLCLDIHMSAHTSVHVCTYRVTHDTDADTYPVKLFKSYCKV